MKAHLPEHSTVLISFSGSNRSRDLILMLSMNIKKNLAYNYVRMLVLMVHEECLVMVCEGMARSMRV